MPQIERRKIFVVILGFLLLVGEWTAVGRIFGPIEGLRFGGILFVLWCAVATFQPTIPVSVGRRQVAELQGWRKAYALVPAYVVGLCISLFAGPIACALPFRDLPCR